MDNKVRIGMISFAHSHAKTYLHALLKMSDVEIAGIADDNRERVGELVRKHGIPYFEHYTTLLQQQLDAVVVCSENALHAEMTIAAAQSGCHVLCEKPLGITVEEMRRMIDACKRNGVQLMTAYPNRYVDAVAEAKRKMERNEIGRIVAIKGTNKGGMPGRWFIERALSGGGAMLDHSVHVMDLMRWMLNANATEVYSENGTLFHDIDIDDSGMVHVRFDNDVIAVLDTSWSRAKSFPFRRDLSMEIIGTEGTITIDDTTQINEIYSDETERVEWSFWGSDRNYAMVRDFVEAVKTGGPVPITGEDGMFAACVALAAYESAEKGCAVKLSFRSER